MLCSFNIDTFLILTLLVLVFFYISTTTFHSNHLLTPYWFLPNSIVQAFSYTLRYYLNYFFYILIHFYNLYLWYFEKNLNQTYIRSILFLSRMWCLNKYSSVIRWSILSLLGWAVSLLILVQSVPRLPYVAKQFLILAFFPAYVTYGLITYTYRVYNNMDLKRPIIKPLPSGKRFVLLVSEKLLETLYSHLLLQKTRLKLWNLFLETLTDNFFFLKKYYRLNDLIWQDGFLIDFLQKKVADRWVRTFIIYSGYLFSERFLFDFVVRFYIDLIIWPTYNNSLYEFSSVSATLTLTLVILMNLFLLLSIYHFMLVL